MNTEAPDLDSTAKEEAIRQFGRNLRTVRLRMNLSQTELAKLFRTVGAELGEPNECSKRLIQKWENDDHRDCRPNYKRLFEASLGVTYEQLCESWSDSDRASDSKPILDQLQSVANQLNSLMLQISDIRDRMFNGHDTNST